MQSQRLKIALVCGGVSPEHEVSLSSGETCAGMLNVEKYDLLPVCVLKNGEWLIPDEWMGESRAADDIDRSFKLFRNPPEANPQGMRRLSVEKVLGALKERAPDVVLILLHGEGGEDGVIQGFMEFGGLRYAGPGVLACSLAMDKIRCLRLLSRENFLTPPCVCRLELAPEPDFRGFMRVAEKKFGYPCFVKPARVGSSVGMSVARDRSELESALQLARRYDSQIVIEEFIQGVEVTCGVLDLCDKDGSARRIILPPTEIVVKQADFFDYESKYTPGLTDEITPARLPERLLKRVKECAAGVYQLIGCSGMSRIDMIVRDEDIYILECNAIPGMTPTSLLPKGAAAAGFSFPELLDVIINHALYGVK